MNLKTHSIQIHTENLPQPPLWVRGLSFILDYFLVSLIAALLITQIFLPLNPTHSWDALISWSESYLSQIQTEGTENLPQPSLGIRDTLLFITESVTLIFLIYFFICDYFFKGRSIGKRIFNIRTFSLVNPDKIPFTNALMRSAAKTLILFYFFPIILFVAILTKFFHKSKQWGHDLISHTKVIDEFKIETLLNEQTRSI